MLPGCDGRKILSHFQQIIRVIRKRNFKLAKLEIRNTKHLRSIARMHHRSKAINRLALFLLAIIVLELILIGDRVQPVKKFKKKLRMRKFKRLFPLPSFIKPKKKLVFIPIPIPIFKGPGHRQPFVRPNANNDRPSTQVPTMMMSNRPTLPIDSSLPPMTMTMLPMNMFATDNNMDPFSMMGFDAVPLAPQPAPSNASNAPQPSVPMTIPSMTMTIQSEPGGTSAIELSTSMMSTRPPNASLPLTQRPQQQQHNYYKSYPLQQQQLENFEEPTEQLESEQYLVSSWPARHSLASPAKVYRGERLLGNLPMSPPGQMRESTSAKVRAPRQQRQAIVLIRNQRRQQAPRLSS